jgi:large subunit ribosomal protein L6
MSRIGRLPVAVPAGVKVEIDGLNVLVKGPKGTLQRTFAPGVTVTLDQGQVVVTRASDEPRLRALHRAAMDGKTLVLNLGYSHPVRVEPPAGITFEVDEKIRQVKVSGSDPEQIGQVAADIRKIRPPEPYKGKGVHYLGEKIRRKAGKAGKGGKGGKK